MWSQVQKIIHAEQPAKPTAKKPALKLGQLTPGSVLEFAKSCPLPEFSGKKATVLGVRHYRFGDDTTISYPLELASVGMFHLTVAEDAQGFYLAMSREIDAREQDAWFGRDALSFFTEESTAKTIRCKADMARDGAWLAERYTKTVDWVAGSVSEGRSVTSIKAPRSFRYNLLVNESGEKALEVEHDEQTGDNRVFVTIYRPTDDILSTSAAVAAPTPAAQQPKARPIAPIAASAPAPAPAARPMNDNKVAFASSTVEAEEPPLFAEPRMARTDFRRKEAEETIHIPATTQQRVAQTQPPLPSFLMSRESNYLSLDEVIPPEYERVRCDLRSGKAIIDIAIARGVRVRDILRELVGLDSMMSDEVMFELPLSDADYRKLASRYKVRAEHRDEIRLRLQEELRKSLIGVAKR